MHLTFNWLKGKIINMNGIPGAVMNENHTIACKNNSIQILEIQRQGKKKQITKEFLLGKKIMDGSILN